MRIFVLFPDFHQLIRRIFKDISIASVRHVETIVVYHDIESRRFLGNRVGLVRLEDFGRRRLIVVIEFVAGQLVVDEVLVLDDGDFA